MARIKFLVFALVVVALWTAHLVVLTPPFIAHGTELAAQSAARVPAMVGQRLTDRRLAVQRAAAGLVKSGVALSALKPTGGRAEAPSAERLEAVRTAVVDALPEDMKPVAIVGLINEAGAVFAQGAAEPVAALEGVDPANLVAAGVDGLVADAAGTSHLFFTAPALTLERGEPKLLGNALVGVPLVTEEVLKGVMKDDPTIGAVALASGGKLLAATGAKKALAEKAQTSLGPGQSGVVERGQVHSMGPVGLPVFPEQSDPVGASTPQWVASRQALGGSPYEVVAVASATGFVEPLVRYQRFGLLGLAGLLLISVVWTFLSGAPASAPGFVGSVPGTREPVAGGRAEPDEPKPPRPMPAGVLPLAEAPAPEANPDDFDFAPSTAQEQAVPPAPPPTDEFPASPGSASALFADPPSSESGTPTAENPWGDAPLPSAAFPGGEDDERTVAYPTHSPQAAALFHTPGQNGSGGAALGNELGSDFNPDATRVAAIPAALLQESARGTDANVPTVRSSAPLPRMPQVAAPAVVEATPEEQHFQEIFREFVATRERCGEGADGLTYEKFAVKLRKNKEQLVQKYNCRTVRFQVYVKEGKAALKATPVKD